MEEEGRNRDYDTTPSPIRNNLPPHPNLPSLHALKVTSRARSLGPGHEVQQDIRTNLIDP
jgi:hypothetical protein